MPDEIASWIAITYGQPVSISTLQHSLKTLGYCVKKLRKAAAQRDQLTREQRKAEILSHFTADQLFESIVALNIQSQRLHEAVLGLIRLVHFEHEEPAEVAHRRLYLCKPYEPAIYGDTK